MSQQDKDFIDSLFRAQRKYLKESEAEGKSFFLKKKSMQQGAVPTPPDTVLGPTFPESSSVSNLLLGLDSTEEAAQGSEIRWDTVDLDDYDFSPFEYPEWVNTLPTDATLDQWFEDNAGPAVNKPFQGQMPTKEEMLSLSLLIRLTSIATTVTFSVATMLPSFSTIRSKSIKGFKI